MIKFKDEGFSIVGINREERIYIEVFPFDPIFIGEGRKYGYGVIMNIKGEPSLSFYENWNILIKTINSIFFNNLKKFEKVLKERLKEKLNRDLV